MPSFAPPLVGRCTHRVNADLIWKEWRNSDLCKSRGRESRGHRRHPFAAFACTFYLFFCLVLFFFCCCFLFHLPLSDRILCLLFFFPRPFSKMLSVLCSLLFLHENRKKKLKFKKIQTSANLLPYCSFVLYCTGLDVI